jgi:hypothetical protein
MIPEIKKIVQPSAFSGQLLAYKLKLPAYEAGLQKGINLVMTTHIYSPL